MNNIWIFLLIILVTNAIQSITGFAGTLLAMPPSILLFGIDEARSILNIITWVACLVISVQNYRYINKFELVKICLFMFPGMIIGFKILNSVPQDLLLKFYGLMIFLIALKGLFLKKEIKISTVILYFSLIIAGIIHGIFVSGGSLLVVYALIKFKNKNEFRATVAPIWLILNSFMFFNHYHSGYLTHKVLLLTLVSLLPVFIGIYVGNKLYAHVNQQLFMNMTYTLLIISGISILV